jgi:hypothetical protein
VQQQTALQLSVAAKAKPVTQQRLRFPAQRAWQL